MAYVSERGSARLVYVMPRRMYEVLRFGDGKENRGYGTHENVADFIRLTVNRRITKIVVR